MGKTVNEIKQEVIEQAEEKMNYSIQQAKIEQLERQNKALSDLNDSLSHQVTDKTKEIETQTETIRFLDEKVKNLTRENASLIGQIEAYEKVLHLRFVD